jgi:putative endonuclease
MSSYVYILASKTAGTLYTGVTSDLVKRVSQHKEGTFKGFTSRYKVNRLVWYEAYGDIEFAIRREKQIKNWLRAWKIRLIEKENPDWRDLFDKIAGVR